MCLPRYSFKLGQVQSCPISVKDGDLVSSFEDFPDVGASGESAPPDRFLPQCTISPSKEMVDSVQSHLIPLIPGARQWMRGLQFHLSRTWDRQSQPDGFLFSWAVVLLEDLQWWLSSPVLWVGQSLQLVSTDVCLFSNASTLCWGASVLQASVSGL